MATWKCPEDWSEWVGWLAAGLHGHCRWRLGVVFLGMLFAQGRRTVASWLRAAGVGHDFRRYYYFLSSVGRKANAVAAPLLRLAMRRLPGGSRILLALDDTPAKRGWQILECTQYGETVTKKYKTFLATDRPAYGMIRVVIVQEPTGPQFFFSADPNATVQEILEAFADRAAIEQVFHDLKEVWGAGLQQVRYLWANIGAYHLNLWMHTLVELWAWRKRHRTHCDRSASPWDDPSRRPSHADRRNALRRTMLRAEFSASAHRRRLPRKILAIVKQLLGLAG